jgi:hypothetical protein
MDTNAKKVLEALPDFNDAQDLIEHIKEITIAKMRLDADIKAQESTNFNEVMNSPKYMIGGKQPAVSYYENAYKYTGIDGNLMILRDKLSTTTAELEALKSRYELYRQMQDMYKTLTFMERGIA